MINNEYFRELALGFKRNDNKYPFQDEYTRIFEEINRNKKKTEKLDYPDFNQLSYEMQDFATYWIDKFVNGYSVGGKMITGEHLFYLNCVNIIITEQHSDKTVTNSKRTTGYRKADFPSYWDEDFKYFWTCDIARWGMSFEKYKKLCDSSFDLGLTVDEENLGGGLNHLWLKPRGVGAEQPHSEILITPKGEITMGNVKVGTQLYDKHGNITNVTEVLPQGIKEIWKVKLLDGREVTCGENHLWTVETRIRKGKPEYKTLTTKKMFESGLIYKHSTGQKTYKYKIPSLKPVKFSEKTLPIPPYVLGALLGDGTINGKNIKIASDDIEIVDKIISDLNKVWIDSYTYTKDNSNNNYTLILKDKFSKTHLDYENSKFGCNPLKRELENLKVNVKCEDKFIPDIYKYGSIEQRFELVKGLMDTDGSVSNEGYCEFSNKSKQLIDDLAYVLRSLGIYCSMSYSKREGLKTITDRNNRTCTFEDSGYWRLYIATNQSIFNLERKFYRINHNKQTKTSVPIIDIYPTGLYEEQSCIIVDNEEHLYLTRDFIVTHNSWKGGAKANYNLFLIPESKTFIFADGEQYLGSKDGFFSKFEHIRSFVQNNVWFLRKDFVIEKKSDYSYQTGYLETVAGAKVTKGFLSSVAGVVVDGDSDKGRGKRGDAIFEEFGSFPNVDSVWNKYEESANEYGIVHGQARGFGTGGDSKTGKIEGYEALRKMFYNPNSYNIIRFKDIYEDIGAGRDFGMFTPAYRNITDIDQYGNSNEKIGKAKLDERRLDWQKSNDSGLYIQKCAELPYMPKEAFSAIGENIFPVKLLDEHLNFLIKSNYHKQFVTTGEMEGCRFIPKTLEPYVEYPVKAGDRDSCVCIFRQPFIVNSKVPDNLYRICVDPYRNDTGGSSIGSIYVIENTNTFTKYKGDMIVAWYNGRPSDDSEQTKFCRILFGLAEMYNAQIGLEIGAESYVLSYAKNRANFDSKGRKLTYYLAPSFELAFDEKLIRKKSNVKLTYGIVMNNERKEQGLNYLKDWLLRPRKYVEGKAVRNLNYIFDIGLLKELIEYKGNNADRISSMVIGSFFEKELGYKQKHHNKSFSDDAFFKNPLFN